MAATAAPLRRACQLSVWSLNRASHPFALTHRLRTCSARRQYSNEASFGAPSLLQGLDASKLEISLSKDQKKLSSPESLIFGHTFTDHMLTAEWTAAEGWLAPKIQPYANLSLDPATCVFHYGFECFEGLKAYKGADGKARLFRPDKNMARMNGSADRIALPTFDGSQMIELVKDFVKVDERFIPTARGYSLYLRPTLIGTQKTLGIGPSGSALFYCIASPVGPYYPTGFKAVTLEATSHTIRAWPGGVGDKKVGGNYAPCVKPQLEAASRGFTQNLWLFGENCAPEDKKVTEVGTMNFFAVLKKGDTKELVTAPLDGTILEGVTRDTVLDLARERLSLKVSERDMTIGELARASEKGELLECFGSGTAAVISPVRNIAWDGKVVDCGLREDQEAGEVATCMKEWIEGIQYGEEGDGEWSVLV